MSSAGLPTRVFITGGTTGPQRSADKGSSYIKTSRNFLPPKFNKSMTARRRS